ncbi:MAG: hypothetical protein CL799_13725 [Chromatiales bacterium]|jgi:hypothetical protein|nr:hypothetical protein [Chromatiales bacterium]
MRKGGRRPEEQEKNPHVVTNESESVPRQQQCRRRRKTLNRANPLYIGGRMGRRRGGARPTDHVHYVVEQVRTPEVMMSTYYKTQQGRAYCSFVVIGKLFPVMRASQADAGRLENMHSG